MKWRVDYKLAVTGGASHTLYFRVQPSDNIGRVFERASIYLTNKYERSSHEIILICQQSTEDWADL